MPFFINVAARGANGTNGTSIFTLPLAASETKSLGNRFSIASQAARSSAVCCEAISLDKDVEILPSGRRDIRKLIGAGLVGELISVKIHKGFLPHCIYIVGGVN